MPRNKEMFDDQLARIIAAFPGRELLTATEVARWLKQDPRTVQAKYTFKGSKRREISIVQLAREMLP
jgi:hypothetical protein